MTATLTVPSPHLWAPGRGPKLGKTVYLTGVSTDLTRAADRPDLGLLVTPQSAIHNQLVHYDLWGADNGRYSESKQGRAFDPDAWLAWLWKLPLDDGCRFAALPDVLDWFWTDVDGSVRKAQPGDAVPTKHGDKKVHSWCVGDLDRTIAQSAEYVDIVRHLGFPVAIVAQDGLASLDQLPFAVDAVFIGGSDDYKLGPVAAGLVAEANAAGLWTHMGRVNSWKRISYAQRIGCDSADGTYILFGPSTNGPKVLQWLDDLDALLATEETP